MADPIITGREELGYAKLFCDIPPARCFEGREYFDASWGGHPFMEMSVQNFEPATLPSSTADGTIHYRYMLSLRRVGGAEVEGLVITPPSPRLEVFDYSVGEGTVRFTRASWAQLPTLAHIVNALADLPHIQDRGCTVSNLRCDTSLHHHRILD